MSEFDKYIITTPMPDEKNRYTLPLDVRRSISFVDSSVIEGACYAECAWYYQPFEGPANHVHSDTDEILGFYGTVMDDPESLGGLIRFRFGDEWIDLEKSCMIYIPAGIPHCPFEVVRVDSPIFHFAITPGQKFKE